jgi:putative oxidoreductase
MAGARLAHAAQDLDENRQLGLDLLRIYLGIALLVRGALFVSQPEVLLGMIQSSGNWLWAAAIGHYVALAHIGGGLLLALGFYTRLAAVVQIPILLGAVFFTHWGEGLLGRGQALELAGLVLVMLVVFACFGAGPLSLDYRMRSRASSEPHHPTPPTYPTYARR